MSRISSALCFLLVFFLAGARSHATDPGAPNLVLEGEVHPSQIKSYFEVPFIVPPGVHRITVSFHNLGRDQHTVLDLGVADPVRFRGNSGGNKDHFTIGESDATPSYLPGPIPSGRWKLLISVPNIRPGITSRYRAEVWFDRALDDSSFTEQPLNDHSGWYRGDLHMHNANSDGSCPSQSGRQVPCPVFVTVDAASRRGLDFIAITDHNATSQYNAMRELQPYFDKTLLIPGRELTTFYGHANMFGSMQYVDYRVGTPQVPDVNTMFRSARQLGAIISINHPESPTGEICMGCGWNPDPPADMHLVTSIEVWNGGGSHVRFWEQQLQKGFRVTAVGGSDNHHGDWPLDKQGSVGSPTTVVHAENLSVQAILSGITAGHVFLDLTGSRDRMLDLTAESAQKTAEMGDDLEPRSGDTVSLSIQVNGCKGDSLSLLVDGQQSVKLPSKPIENSDQLLHATWQADGSRHWIRAEVRDAQGNLVLFGNPVYLNFEASARTNDRNQ
jgi:hypothetical protein